MRVVDYQLITYKDLEETDDTILVYDENLRGDATLSTDYTRLDDATKLYGFVTYVEGYIKKGIYRRRAVPIPLGQYIEDVYPMEVALLKEKLEQYPHKNFLIYPLGFMLNRSMTFFQCIRPRLPEDLKNYKNVTLMWNNIPEYIELRKNYLMATDYGNDGHIYTYKVPYEYIKKTGNIIDLNRLNNKHIPIDIPTGVYVEEN